MSILPSTVRSHHQALAASRWCDPDELTRGAARPSPHPLGGMEASPELTSPPVGLALHKAVRGAWPPSNPPLLRCFLVDVECTPSISFANGLCRLALSPLSQVTCGLELLGFCWAQP